MSLPDVVITGKRMALLEDELDGQKRRRHLGGQGGSDKRQATSMRMPDVVFPNNGNGGGPRMMLATHNNQIIHGEEDGTNGLPNEKKNE